MTRLLDRVARRTAVDEDDRDGLDYLARRLVTAPISRRRALVVGGTTLMWLGLGGRGPGLAWAQSSCDCPNGCHGPDDIYCSTPCDSGWITCEDPGGKRQHCCEQGTTCCSSQYDSEPCCASGYDCCKGFLCCQPGYTCCLDPQPVDSSGLRGGVCCAEGSSCGSNGECGGSCPEAQQCGSDCCPDGQFCCDDNNGLCCDNDVACCSAGSPGNKHQVCCAKGYECTDEILPGQGGITDNSPTVCCPPERVVSFVSSHPCCPPGSVRNPRGAVTSTGLCCTSAKVCGQDCCESLPAFPKHCVDGRYCDFDLAKLTGKSATVSPGGNAAIPMSFSGPASGTVSLEALPGGGGAQMAAVKRPIVLGSAHFRRHHGGRMTVKVHLNATGRRRLKRRHHLHVSAVITFKKHGKAAKTATPFTLKSR